MIGRSTRSWLSNVVPAAYYYSREQRDTDDVVILLAEYRKKQSLPAQKDRLIFC